jgi:hypothetical protein
MFTAGTLPRYSLVLGRASKNVPDPWSFEWTLEGALANNTVDGNPCMDSTPKTTPQKKRDGG